MRTAPGREGGAAAGRGRKAYWRLGAGKRRRTEGGEALIAVESAVGAASHQVGTPPFAWYVVWTHSNCEQLVHDQLQAQGFELLFPKMAVWSHRGGQRRLVQAPLFPGYLFAHFVLDKRSYLDMIKARGVVRILGGKTWDAVLPVPDAEMHAISRVADAGVPVLPYPFLREGQRARIVAGPLKDVEGVLVQRKPNKGLLVLSVELLQRSVAVEVDATLVEPA